MGKSKEHKRNNYMSDPMAVTWSAKYSENFQKYWDRLPGFLGTFIASLAVFILGSTIRGEWLHILVHFIRAFNNDPIQNATSSTPGAESPHFIFLGTEMKDFWFYYIMATSVSYISFFGIGGFLHWYYYVRQRDTPQEWKCQPDTWMSPELERHEILMGSFSLIIGSFLSSVLACYILNGGWTTVYYDISDHSMIWYILSWPVVYIYQDYLTYWHHRMYHTPFLYKNFHKLHHKYKQPTAFSVTAIHPFEFVHIQAVVMSPMFLFPVHWTVVVTILAYIYYHGMIDHSGINFKSYWWQPWQPDCIFHDNHHQYFHVNFGFNCELWDKIHGTYRKKDKVYREDIFYGKGKALEDCTHEELLQDLEEREAENKDAYRDSSQKDQVDVLRKRIK